MIWLVLQFPLPIGNAILMANVVPEAIGFEGMENNWFSCMVKGYKSISK
jgi:hypothetical protein